MQISRQDLLSQYQDAYQQLCDAFEAVPAENRSQRPAPDKWSPAEIIYHLLDSELNLSVRLRRVVAEDAPALAAFDQNRWAMKLHYSDLDYRAGLLGFGMLRELNTNLLLLLSDQQWELKGIHQERGPMTITDLIAYSVKHGDNHIKQIQALKP